MTLEGSYQALAQWAGDIMSWAWANVTKLTAISVAICAVVTLCLKLRSNRTKPNLNITARFHVEDIYDIGQVPEENTIKTDKGTLFTVKPPIVRQDHGLHFDIRNTGKDEEQIIAVGYRLRNGEKGEFQSPDPRAVMNLPPEIKLRLPFTVQAGLTRQLFWAFTKPEQEKSEKITHVWFESARGTVRVKICR